MENSSTIASYGGTPIEVLGIDLGLLYRMFISENANERRGHELDGYTIQLSIDRRESASDGNADPIAPYTHQDVYYYSGRGRGGRALAPHRSKLGRKTGKGWSQGQREGMISHHKN